MGIRTVQACLTLYTEMQATEREERAAEKRNETDRD